MSQSSEGAGGPVEEKPKMNVNWGHLSYKQGSVPQSRARNRKKGRKDGGRKRESVHGGGRSGSEENEQQVRGLMSEIFH